MKCPRCKGFIFYEPPSYPYPEGYRCINCGERFKEEVIKVEEEKYICKTEGCGRAISKARAEGQGLCSRCQTSLWQKSQRKARHPEQEAGDQGKCAQCGKAFIKKRHDMRFCGDECRNIWGREEKKRKYAAGQGNGNGEWVKGKAVVSVKSVPQGDVTPELLAAAGTLQDILRGMIKPIETALQEVKERYAL